MFLSEIRGVVEYNVRLFWRAGLCFHMWRTLVLLLSDIKGLSRTPRGSYRILCDMSTPPPRRRTRKYLELTNTTTTSYQPA